jgi:hypothetical protein
VLLPEPLLPTIYVVLLAGKRKLTSTSANSEGLDGYANET